MGREKYLINEEQDAAFNHPETFWQHGDNPAHK